VEIVAEEESISIPTPTRQIARGERLDNIQFATVRWPKSRLQDGQYLLSVAGLGSTYAMSPLPAHLPVPLASLSTSAPDQNAVAEAIPQGMRAITVKVDAESAIEGWARSGNFIDVILVRTAKEQGLESLIIAENVKILSAGASAQPMASGDTAPKAPNTVTLLVSQEDALKIKTASNLGKLTFALRGTGDSSPTVAVSVDQKKLFGVAPKPVSFTGRATGPDGSQYVLAKDKRWFRAGEQVE
jgi:pilus assembly protein CpaB